MELISLTCWRAAALQRTRDCNSVTYESSSCGDPPNYYHPGEDASEILRDVVATRDALVPRAMCVFPSRCSLTDWKIFHHKEGHCIGGNSLDSPVCKFVHALWADTNSLLIVKRARPATSRAKNRGRCLPESNCFRLSVPNKAPSCIAAHSLLGEVE